METGKTAKLLLLLVSLACTRTSVIDYWERLETHRKAAGQGSTRQLVERTTERELAFKSLDPRIFSLPFTMLPLLLHPQIPPLLPLFIHFATVAYLDPY